MEYLIDTCAAIFCWGGSERLSDPARKALMDTENVLWFHQISYLEITVKASLGKLDLGEAASSFVPKALAAYRMRYVRLRNRDISRLEGLPFRHRDPFDRLLIAHALDRSLPVVTPDAVFSAHGVATVW